MKNHQLQIAIDGVEASHERVQIDEHLDPRDEIRIETEKQYRQVEMLMKAIECCLRLEEELQILVEYCGGNKANY